jgi:hypothetical protein
MSCFSSHTIRARLNILRASGVSGSGSRLASAVALGFVSDFGGG